MSTLKNFATKRVLFYLILSLGCLLFPVSLTSQVQAQESYDPWKRRQELQEGIKNCDGLRQKLETGEYVAVKNGDRLISVPKKNVIEELTLQLLAGEITPAEMTEMSRLLGIWSKQRIANLNEERKILSERLARLEADLGVDISGRTTPPGGTGTKGTTGATTGWTGTWVGGGDTVTISATGNSISASFQYKHPPHSTGTGQWTNCKIEGNKATCNWSENYDDEDKSAVRGGTLVVTLNGDSITGQSLEENEPRFTWKQGISPYSSSIRKGARWSINLTRKK